MPEAKDNTESSRRKKRSRIGLISIIVVAILSIGGGLFYFMNAADSAEANDTVADGSEAEENKKDPVPVEVVDVGIGTVSDYLSSTANLVAENEVRILAEAEGRVASLKVDEGAFVKKGQILAVLVRDEAEIAVTKARLSEENARRAQDRAQELIERDLLSREDFDQTLVDFEIAQQELADAEWKLSKTTIRSPFSGRISERMIQVGQHVRWGDQLFQVTDFDPLIARIYLAEKDVLGLEENRAVRISLNAADDVHFTGRIRQISPVVDPETGTIKLTIEALQPPTEVRPGSFVTIDIIRATHEQVVILPRDSVIRELQNSHIFVAEDEVAEKRPVTLGLEESEWIEVLSGVEAGEQVIVAGQGGLKDGAAVKAMWADGTPVHPVEENDTEVAADDSDSAEIAADEQTAQVASGDEVPGTSDANEVAGTSASASDADEVPGTSASTSDADTAGDDIREG